MLMYVLQMLDRSILFQKEIFIVVQDIFSAQQGDSIVPQLLKFPELY